MMMAKGEVSQRDLPIGYGLGRGPDVVGPLVAKLYCTVVSGNVQSSPGKVHQDRIIPGQGDPTLEGEHNFSSGKEDLVRLRLTRHIGRGERPEGDRSGKGHRAPFRSRYAPGQDLPVEARVLPLYGQGHLKTSGYDGHVLQEWRAVDFFLPGIQVLVVHGELSLNDR